MKPRKTPRDWRRLVLRDPYISDATRVLLLVLAEHMRANDLQVSVPRKELARILNRSEKRIQERIKQAHAEGLLETVTGGYRGHTAVYVAAFGKAERGTPTRALLGSENRPPFSSGISHLPEECETPGGPTSSKRAPSGTAAGNVHNGEQRREADGASRAIVRAAVNQLRDEGREERTA